MNLITQQYSFVRFDANRFILPVHQNDVLAFQVRVDASTDSSNFAVTFTSIDDNSNVTLNNVIILKDNVTLYVSFKIIGTLLFDKKYKITLYYTEADDSPNNAEFESNHFIASNVESTHIAYYHNKSHLDFYYSQNYMNQIRLPFRLFNASTFSDTQKFTKSNGQILTFGNYISKIYNIETEYMNADFHQCFHAMLLHRYIHTEIDGVNKSLQLSEEYNIEYPNRMFGLAVGTAKLSAF